MTQHRNRKLVSKIKMNSTLLFVLLAFLAASVQCGSVLMYIPYGTRSHWHAWRPLAHELADRGHHLTVIAAEKDERLAGMENVEVIVTGFDVNAFTNSTAVFEGKQIVDFGKALSNMDKVIE